MVTGAIPTQGSRSRSCTTVRSPEPAGPLSWHNGGTNGFRSFVGVARDRGIAVIVLSNTARSVDRLGLRLLQGARPSSAG